MYLLDQRAAGIEVGVVGGVVPIGEVGDEPQDDLPQPSSVSMASYARFWVTA